LTKKFGLMIVFIIF